MWLLGGWREATKAFRLVLDGKPLGDFGIADVNNASVIVGIGPSHDTQLYVGGLTEPDQSGVCRHFGWSLPEMREGSGIEIEIVKSEDYLPPTRLYRSDHQVQEPAFTEEEMREMRYQDYLKLKEEFER
jgi:hypothetical protein